MSRTKSLISRWLVLCGVVLVLAFLPACRKKDGDKQRKVTQEAPVTNTALGIYDEDIEAFVLEESLDPLDGTQHDHAGVSFTIDAEDMAPANASAYGLKTIYFDFDKYAIRKDQKAVVEHDIKRIKELINRGHTVVIEGHACNSAGSAAYNLQLSEKRARVIYDRLISAGVSKEKLRCVGRGFEMCMVSHGNRHQQAPNRRVEFYITQPS